MPRGANKLKITYQNAPILEEVVGKKRPLSDVMRNYFRPNPSVMRLIGKEMISGYKGGASINVANLHFGPKGGVYGNASAERYPNGIWQQRSPDGEPYIPLSEETKKIKRRDDRADEKPRSLTPDTALVDTRGLVDNLHAIPYPDHVIVTYSDPEADDRSLAMEKGGKFDTGLTKIVGRNKNGTKKTQPMKVFVPARPHRGIQPKVVEKIRGILLKWLNRKLA